jgi:tRNA 2-selenouridine synthase
MGINNNGVNYFAIFASRAIFVSLSIYGAAMNFESYDLIIDARSPSEYLQDHLPGAMNMPVVDDVEYAEVGTLHRTDKMGAYRLGVGYALRNIARHLDQNLLECDRHSRILIYCFRGGKRSRLWFDALDTIGYKVDKLKGGWKAYRRWVNEQLAYAPGSYQYKVLTGPTGCGKTRLLYALREAGVQVLDLEAIAMHRGSVIGAIPGFAQPTQKYFDTLLLKQLLSFDPNRPIWVEAESKKIGNVQLPTALLCAMHRGTTIRIDAVMTQRVKLWREDYRHFEDDPLGMLARLSFLRALVGGDEFAAWEALAHEGRMPELFERLMVNHYDPAYRRSCLRNYPAIDSAPTIMLEDLSPDGLKAACQRFTLLESPPQ